jgi:lysyl endopeptidase
MIGTQLLQCATAALLLVAGSIAVADEWAAAAPDGLSHKPTALQTGAAEASSVATIEMPALDFNELELEDEQRFLDGLAPRYAVPFDAYATPDSNGTWEDLGDGRLLWRLRVTSPNAVSINFGFTGYDMPQGGQLYIHATDNTADIRAFTAADNDAHGELWTPPVPGSDVTLEVTIPAERRDELGLELGFINLGYRGFHSKDDGFGESGSCNVDVVCPEGDDWRDEIATVGVISTGGSTFCTGFMVNNTAEDGTPFFMTADHCGIGTGNDQSLVVFWNFETSECDGTPNGSLSDFQSGSVHLASYSSSDMTLVLLDDMPDPEWGVAYAGWDNSGVDTPMAVAIHHPNTDEKRISFEYDPTTTTSYLGDSSPGNGTHVRVQDWDIGTTEPGSSGSPLFDQNHRVIGQLHGGYAACGNDLEDWYGKFSVSWPNGLSSHLDPIGSGATVVDTYVPGQSGMAVSPAGAFAAEGPVGGPFTPSSVVYTLKNNSDFPIDYTVSKSVGWLTIDNGAGTLAADSSALVTVSINGGADGFGTGQYTDTLSFVNQTDSDGDTTRPVLLDVGVPVVIYEFPLNTNPGWQTQGQWAFGQPSGNGGEYGNADPNSGYTGSNVFGYNLNGDYANDLSEQHLTTNAIDCSGLSRVSVKFRRWLGVEKSTYDHAYLRASTNGTTWTTVWSNPDEEIADSSWKYLEYDLSSLADGQSTVYLRWTMGTTDGSWRYCGWNIDDVEIWGIEASLGIPADLNGDGCVDQSDLGILLASYGVDDGGDIDGDGDTDQGDLGELLASYLVGC